MNKKRVVTGIFIAIVYVAVLLLSVYVHPIFFDLFIILLALGGVYEMNKAISKAYSPPIFVINLVEVWLSFAAFWFAQYYFKTRSAGIIAYFIALAVMVVVTLIVTGCSKKYVKGNAVSTIGIMLYPCALLMLCMDINYYMMSGSVGIEYSLPHRNIGIMLMFLVPALTDVFAYQVGSAIKGKKLCPSISPNKTISGAVGGLFGGLFGAGLVLLLIYLASRFGVNLFGLQMLTSGWTGTIVNLLMLGLFGSVFDQIGDLVASFIKRRVGIKDFSNLLPGHGGVLDRVDGFILCGVFYYMYFAIMILI